MTKPISKLMKSFLMKIVKNYIFFALFDIIDIRSSRRLIV